MKSHEIKAEHSALNAELMELLSVVGPARVADQLLQRCFDYNATDIHLDPTENGVRVRVRIDGALRDVLIVPKSQSAPFLSRIKVMAGMDITEKRHPQDGHISANSGVTPRDVRVGSGPTIHGERLVLRLMPNADELQTPEEIGLDGDQRGQIEEMLRTPYGLILVVGPVGSGKTTTVYSMLNELIHPEKSIVTIEDPVERRLEGTCQIQVDTKIDLGFAAALRGVLRQDPDVLAIGEIRDQETAQIACRAALTGVLVLSTLHANDTTSAIDVLRQFGVPSSMIASCMTGIISQRLVRLVCQESQETFVPDEATCRLLGLDTSEAAKHPLVRGIPADENFGTGYHGRTGVFEILRPSSELRNQISSGAANHQIRDVAMAEGMETLETATQKLVLKQMTSLGELHRVMTDTAMRR